MTLAQLPETKGLHPYETCHHAFSCFSNVGLLCPCLRIGTSKLACRSWRRIQRFGYGERRRCLLPTRSPRLLHALRRMG